MILVTFWYQVVVGYSEIFAHFCFAGRIVIQDQIISVAIPFPRLCYFPSVWNKVCPVFNHVASPAVDAN